MNAHWENQDQQVVYLFIFLIAFFFFYFSIFFFFCFSCPFSPYFYFRCSTSSISDIVVVDIEWFTIIAFY